MCKMQSNLNEMYIEFSSLISTLKKMLETSSGDSSNSDGIPQVHPNETDMKDGNGRSNGLNEWAMHGSEKHNHISTPFSTVKLAESIQPMDFHKLDSNAVALFQPTDIDYPQSASYSCTQKSGMAKILRRCSKRKPSKWLKSPYVLSKV